MTLTTYLATRHLNFPFDRRALCFFLLLLFLSLSFTLGKLWLKKSWCFQLFRRPLFILEGGIPPSYLSGSHCFPLLDGYTQRIWKLKGTVEISRANFPLQVKKQSPDQWWLLICPRSHGLSVTAWRKTTLSSHHNAGSWKRDTMFSCCQSLPLLICLAHLLTVWHFSLEPTWTHHGLTQKNQIKEAFIFQLPCACNIQRRGAGNAGGEGRKHLSFNIGLTWKPHWWGIVEPSELTITAKTKDETDPLVMWLLKHDLPCIMLAGTWGSRF